jgi:hypothetical protein
VNLSGDLEITPEPSDAERAAIVAALEAEAKEKALSGPSPWAASVVTKDDAHP